MNIRSLNSKVGQLCQLFELLNIDFDVIALSEMWTTNIDFCANILPGYNFYYDLPDHSIVGGVGIYVTYYLSDNCLNRFCIMVSNCHHRLILVCIWDQIHTHTHKAFIYL